MKQILILLLFTTSLFAQISDSWTTEQKQFARKGDILDSIATLITEQRPVLYDPNWTHSSTTYTFIIGDYFLKGSIKNIYMYVASTGYVNFFIATKIGNTRFHIVKEFDVYATAGLNNINCDIPVVQDTFYVGIKETSVKIKYKNATTLNDIWRGGNFSTLTDSTDYVPLDVSLNIQLTVESGRIYSKQKSYKRISYIGDSITDFCDSPSTNGKQYYGYTSYIADKIEFAATNINGYDGYTMTNSTASSYLGAWILNKFSEFAISDIYVIFLGANDFRYNRTIGNYASHYLAKDDTTFYGSIKTIIDTLYSKNSKAQIFIVKPPHFNKTYNTTTQNNGNDNSFLDYINAIDTVCIKNGITSIDVMRESNITNSNFNLYYYDNIHPNSIGYKKIANSIFKTIESLIE